MSPASPQCAFVFPITAMTRDVSDYGDFYTPTRPFSTFCCKQRRLTEIDAWASLASRLGDPRVAQGPPKPPNPIPIGRGSQALPSSQQLGASSFFVKDRSTHHFFALERISKFTICSPFCQARSGENTVANSRLPDENRAEHTPASGKVLGGRAAL